MRAWINNHIHVRQYDVIKRRQADTGDGQNEGHAASEKTAVGTVNRRQADTGDGQGEGHAASEKTAVGTVTPSGANTRSAGQETEPQDTHQQPTHTQQPQVGKQSKTYAHVLRERLPDTVVIGTSLGERGRGSTPWERYW